MTRFALALALVFVPVVSAVTGAQTAPPPPTAQTAVRASDLTSLEVQVVITRLDRGKVVSTLPYTLAVTTNAGEAQLNMGTEVPVPTTTYVPAPAPASAQANAMAGAAAAPVQGGRPMTSTSYRPVGTVITCRAIKRDDDARYQLVLQVDDSAIFTSGQAAPPLPVGDTMPVFRSFRSRNTLMLADGQTRQYTAASDRVSGEVVRLDVTVRALK